ncbi:MAG: MBL fold metallo-hydrolase, partial [Chloroflexi bacterium]|nr:MBL fold metallo-hydrolase [Chloroflexota bacterium]
MVKTSVSGNRPRCGTVEKTQSCASVARLKVTCARKRDTTWRREFARLVLDIPFLGPITIAPGVYQLRALGARVTVLEAPDGVVLVDTGSRGSLHVIAAGLKALGVAPEQVRLIAL